MYKLTFLLLLFNAFNCVSQKSGFTISGNIEGIEDGQLIYLMDENSQVLDSTVLLNQQFVFEGLAEEPKKVFVFIKETMDFKSFWLENTSIVFTAKSKDFNNAKISGSETQTLQTILDKRLSYKSVGYLETIKGLF